MEHGTEWRSNHRALKTSEIKSHFPLGIKAEVPPELYNVNMQQSKPAHWYILTIPKDVYSPGLPLHPKLGYIKGQLEEASSGFLHWQVVAYLKDKARLPAAKSFFPQESHLEPTRSSAARDYVWKDESSLGHRFEFGELPFRRNVKTDWEDIKKKAIRGELLTISGNVYIPYYNSLCRIAADNATPVPIVRSISLFWGCTGTGKSRRAWEEAGPLAYPKDPRTKWWCGYRGQSHVIIDEFRGGVDIAHLLRWFDRYPCLVERKGGSLPLSATKIWITSNLSWEDWYPALDEQTKAALRRRLDVVIRFPGLIQ